MATGFEMQLIQHQGEYIVAAELCSRGYLATTFTGNIPDFDIIAVDKNFRAIPVQVKAIKGGTWQFNAERFLVIEKEGGVQRVLGKKKLPNPKLIWIFAYLDETETEFYLLNEKKVQEIIFRTYKRSIEKKGGRRPRNPMSTHTTIDRKMLKRYRDNWGIIEESLK